MKPIYKRAAHTERRTWRFLRKTFGRKGLVRAARRIALVRRRFGSQSGNFRSAVAALAKRVRAARRRAGPESGRCPYCGGPYSITESCLGPRGTAATANACRRMAIHQDLIRMETTR